jgi:hypothetical protein
MKFMTETEILESVRHGRYIDESSLHFQCPMGGDRWLPQEAQGMDVINGTSVLKHTVTVLEKHISTLIICF